MTTNTETMQEIDAYLVWATNVREPVVSDDVEPDQAPDPEYADMSIAERDMWLDEHQREAAEWERDQDSRYFAPYR